MKVLRFAGTILFMCCLYLQAGEGPGLTFSGFGGPAFRTTLLNDEIGMLAGARGGLLINSIFAVGAGGYGLVDGVRSDSPEKQKIGMYYGGGIIDWIIRPIETVHGGFTLLIGGGTINLRDKPESGDGFFVLEPEWFFEGNVTTFLQIDLSIGIRLLFGSDQHIRDFLGYSNGFVGVMVKFGKFQIEYE